jgi:hypothetical protein
MREDANIEPTSLFTTVRMGAQKIPACKCGDFISKSERNYTI